MGQRGASGTRAGAGSSEFRFLEGAHGVLLGIDPAAAYTVGETGLPPGSAMLLYTDET